jgi:SAM-dependent methyltransferase
MDRIKPKTISWHGEGKMQGKISEETEKAEFMQKIEAMKKSKEENQRKAQEALEQKIGVLREKDHSAIFANKLSTEVLSKVGFLEKIIILEKAIELGKIGRKDMQALFETDSSDEVKLAVMETFSKLKFVDEEEKTEALDWLENVGKYFSGNIYFDGDRASDEIDEQHLMELSLDWSEEKDAEQMIITSAIERISEMAREDDATERLLRIFENTGFEQDNDPEDLTEDGGKKIITKESLPLDRRKELMYSDDKEYYDSSYYERCHVVQLLAEKKSQKSIDYFINYLKESDESTVVYRKEIRELLETDTEYAWKKTMEILGGEKLSDEQIFRFVTLMTDMLGDIAMRDRVDREIIQEKLNGNSERLENLERVRSFFTPNSDKDAILNLQNFYQNSIKFEDYKVNERMNEKEVALLESLIGKDEKVLEMGCGAGRLISELAKSGYDISGYDYTERHVQITKERLEENNLPAKVFQGDWHNNALKDESFDSVYSLGRNILHDYSILSQAELFKEAARILKPGGQFIFDIPAREKATEQELAKLWKKRGAKEYELENQKESKAEIEVELQKWEDEALAEFNGYEKMVLKYGLEMKKRGIDNFRFGAIYDSPDGENFATRYAYSPEDITQLAQMFGFEITKVKREKLETDKNDENLYYILKKKKEH